MLHFVKQTVTLMVLSLFITAPLTFALERSVEVPGQSLDADGDGMDDDWESVNGLDPYDVADAALDPDGDKLINILEYQFGGDPNLKDTDGGGVSDFDEYVLSTALQDVGSELLAGTWESSEWTWSSGSSSTNVVLDWSLVLTTSFNLTSVVNTSSTSSSGSLTFIANNNTILTKPTQGDEYVWVGNATTTTTVAHLGSSLLMLGNSAALSSTGSDGSQDTKERGRSSNSRGVGIDSDGSTAVLDAVSAGSYYSLGDSSDDATAKESIRALKAAGVWKRLVDVANGQTTAGVVAGILLGTILDYNNAWYLGFDWAAFLAEYGLGYIELASAGPELVGGGEAAMAISAHRPSTLLSLPVNGFSDSSGGGGSYDSGSTGSSTSQNNGVVAAGAGGQGMLGGSGFSAAGGSPLVVRSIVHPAPESHHRAEGVVSAGHVGHASASSSQSQSVVVSNGEHHSHRVHDSDGGSGGALVQASEKSVSQSSAQVVSPQDATSSSGGAWWVAGGLPLLGFLTRRLLAVLIG